MFPNRFTAPLRNNPLLALVAAVALTAALAITVGGDPAPESVPQAAAPPVPVITSTSTTIDLEISEDEVKALVLSAGEVELTEEAANASTTTTIPPTTTTTAVTTTTKPAAGQPRPSPTTTAPPATTTTTAAPEGVEPGFRSGAESEFRSLVNSLRSSNGKSALSSDGSLNARARDWAKRMSDEGKLMHSNLSSLLPPWSAAGENVGTGGSVSVIFNSLKGSSGHLSTMLGDFTHFGVGVYMDTAGVLWTVHVFTR